MNKVARFKHPKIISGKLKSFIGFLFTAQFLVLALWQYRSLKISREVLGSVRKLKNDLLGETDFSRIIFSGKKFYFNVHIPGFPSRFQVKNQLGELHRIRPVSTSFNRLRVLLLSITNKCPFQCKHCYEWNNLNKPDPLSVDDYKALLSKFTDAGIGQVHFGGGEPMLKYNDLIELTRFLKGRTEIWIATSGLGLSYEKAKELKKAGLTGAAISVDHYTPELHNEFRGSDRSFQWAMDATENSLRAGLVTCWSICTTREFISRDNLYQYASLAASKGVHFIQIFEPEPAGRFKGRDVLLSQEQLLLLEDFYIEYNKDKSLKGQPLITYHGYHQRRMGCMGGGNRYLYIDAAGNLHSCPFCRNDHKLDALQEPVGILLEKLSREKCLIAGD